MNKKLLLISDVDFQKRRKGSHNRIFSLVESLMNINIDVTFFYIGTSVNIFDTNPLKLNINADNVSYNIFSSYIKRGVNKLNRLKNRRYIIKPNAKVAKSLNKHLLNHQYDFVIFEYIKTSYLLNIVKKHSDAITFIDTHDLMYQRYEEFKHFDIEHQVLKISKDEEIKILSEFDHVIAIQNEEAESLKEHLNNKVITMMHGINKEVFNNFTYKVKTKNKLNKLNIVFFGSAASFNVDSIDWFVKNIWVDDRVRKEYDFHIYGLVCNKLIDMSKDINIHGIVNNINEVYENADVVINPVRFGSGLKIKNVEAMAYGIPLITTSVGIQGMKSISQKEIIVADNAKEFTIELIKLVQNKVRFSLSNSSKKYAKDYFSQDTCFKELKNTLVKRQ
jgi:glycosyltransferase involved in cell wall biosynthesis